MSPNLQEIANAIRDLVAMGGHVPGSRLSALLKARVPEWRPTDFGVRSLREFVVTHVAEVVVAGRSGMDVIYALEGAAPAPATAVAPLPIQVDFWRVWVSPNSPLALVVDRTSAALCSAPRGGPVEPGQVLLEPPGVDVHRDVAQAFLSSVPPALQAKLQAVLDSASEQWWQAWLSELRGTEYLAPWNAFRCQAFEERLATKLRAAGLEQPAIEGILKTVRERHVLVTPHARRATVEGLQQDAAAAALRRIVTDAVQRMSVSELRELRLPIGIVLDILATSKSR